MFKQYLTNVRMYSFMDIIFLGLLAKFSSTRLLTFDFFDLLVAACLIFLWCFYNYKLEFNHNYKYRGKISSKVGYVFLSLAIAITAYVNYQTLIFLFLSTILVLTYSKKNEGILFCLNSMFVRGAIQATYFLYAKSMYGTIIPLKQSIVLALIIFLLHTARSVIADLRDLFHNKEMNKCTIPVLYGTRKGKLVILILLGLAIFIQTTFFKSLIIILPLFLYSIGVIIYSNGYVLHQLITLTTLFFHITMITFFTGGNLILTSLIYLAILLNNMTYHMLVRKSNPTFVQENKYSLMQ